MSADKKQQLKAIRGMNDILPPDTELWQNVETICQQVLSGRGYQEIRLPIVEQTQLFLRSIGADTDIVSKEMYTFDDRNGDSLTLRPEGTASCARAGIEHGMFYNQQQRLWYCGPMFRHERPQKGRYRQFHQLGAEAYGWTTPDIEAELIAVVHDMFERLGLRGTRLQINSLGDQQTRTQFRDALQNYLRPRKDKLDEDSQRRLESNPLRILDSKNADTQEILNGAPVLSDFLSEESSQHFALLQEFLVQLGIEFEINTKLVRGLDYYNDTVFEWINDGFGAQSTVCAGGRYDSLVEQIGGAATPGFGFAMGLERLVQILQEQNAAIAERSSKIDVYLISTGDAARGQALNMQSKLAKIGLNAVLHCGQSSLKNQFKRADKQGARVALIVGEEESAAKTVGIKILDRSAAPQSQQTVKQNDVVNAVTNCLESL